MPKIFISYNRESEAIVRALAGDVEALGHDVWMDQELSGGQIWWDQILEQIRACDVFVFALSQKALDSVPCQREFNYADKLGKPILPVLVAEVVSLNLLPPELSQIQFVDYLKQDRETVLNLARAFTSVPTPKPLPDPLPEPPDVPISYLGSLKEQIETTPALDFQEQSALIIDLKKNFRDPKTSDDARSLLESLRRRRDLFATIRDEIDEILDNRTSAEAPTPQAPESVEARKPAAQEQEETPAKLPKFTPVVTKPLEPKPQIAPNPEATPAAPQTTEPPSPEKQPNLIKRLRRERSDGAITFFAFGFVLGGLFGQIRTGSSDFDFLAAFLYGLSGAAAGFISGISWTTGIGAIVGGVVSVLLWWNIRFGGMPDVGEVELSIAGMIGVILGALLGRVLQKLFGWK